MDYDHFAADLPPDRTTTFGSAEECEETMKRWGVKQEMQQLGAGDYHSNVAVLTTEEAELYADRFSKAVSMHLEPPAGAVGILFPRSASGKFLAYGQDVGNEKLILMPEGSAVDIVIPDLSGSEAITLSRPRFVELTEVLAPTYDRHEELAVVECNMTQLVELRQALIRLLTQAEPEANAEQLANLVAATVLYISESLSKVARVEKPHTLNARMRIARQTQAYIDKHYQETIHIEYLCRHAGVGVRTLQRSFRQYFDFTISDYVKTVRLNMALRELTAAHPAENTVTDIAIRNGCAHLGRFSTEFRERFGQSPKQALDMQANQKS